MIKFFRKIRQRLLTKNKFVKYLLYAIGEILLIVMSIILALEFNQSNQQRIDDNLAREQLLRIRRDLKQDVDNFLEITKENDQSVTSLDEVLNMIYDKKYSWSDVSPISKAYRKINQGFSPNNGAYKSMIGSGTFSLIKNSELKESIINLYHEYDQKQTLINSNKKWIDEISVIVYTKTDLMKFEGDVGVIFDSPEMIRND